VGNNLSAKKTSTKRLGSYPYVNVIFSITTALFMIGLFGLLALFTTNLTKQIQQNIEMQVFLKNNLAETEIYEVQELIGEKVYIAQKDGEPRVTFISKEEAAERLINENGEDFISFLGENPLRHAFIINIRQEFQTNKQMEEIKVGIESMPQVYEVVYTPNLINEINENLDKIGLVLSFFVVILIGTVVILINNSIRLALFSQRFLIRSMQLVGATPAFIKQPFLKRSALHGLFSGLFATGILLVMSYLAMGQLPELKAVFHFGQVVLLSIFLMAIGVLISLSSAYFSVSKYLNMQLDDLY